MRVRIASAVLALGLLGTSALVGAEEALRFPILSYRVEGNTRLAADALERGLAGYTGPNQTFADIQQAVAELQRLYAEAGYGAIRINIPQQDIGKGIVVLQVVEATVATVEVTGNRNFDADNIRASLPELREGQIPDLNAIGVGLRLGNEGFAKQARLTLRQGQTADTVDAIVQVADDTPFRQVVTLDNSGTERTGDWRLGYAFQHANLFNRDHTLTAQVVTSPGHFDDVKILGANYRIPLYRLGGSLDLTASHSSVSSGLVNTTAGAYSISGSGNVYGIKYTHLLPRLRDWDQRLSLGVEYRKYGNDVTLAGTGDSLVPDLVVHPLTLAYSGFMREEGREWGGSVSYSRNIPGGEHGNTEAFRAPGARAQARGNYSLWRFALYLQQSLPADWQLHGRVNGQGTGDALIAGEQFGIGGAESVRGFRERAASNDRGYRASVEIRAPNVGRQFNSESLTLRPVLFTDVGEVWRNHALAGEDTHTRLASTGVGLRAAYGIRAQFRVDYAHVTEGNGLRGRDDKRVQGALTLLF